MSVFPCTAPGTLQSAAGFWTTAFHRRQRRFRCRACADAELRFGLRAALRRRGGCGSPRFGRFIAARAAADSGRNCQRRRTQGLCAPVACELRIPRAARLGASTPPFFWSVWCCTKARCRPVISDRRKAFTAFRNPGWASRVRESVSKMRRRREVILQGTNKIIVASRYVRFPSDREIAVCIAPDCSLTPCVAAFSSPYVRKDRDSQYL
jgi:hypothetical protein